MVLAHAFNIGTGELMLILLVGLLVFGPNKLPEVARRVGRATRTLRKMSNSFRDEMRHTMAEMDASAQAESAAEKSASDKDDDPYGEVDPALKTEPELD